MSKFGVHANISIAKSLDYKALAIFTDLILFD